MIKTLLTNFIPLHVFKSLILAAVCACVFSMSGHAMDVTEHNNACLPIDMPTQDFILDSEKKIFAHYFNRFPLSFDNKYFFRDYYTVHYLNPEGENGKWKPNGGFLRSRPVTVIPKNQSAYQIENLKTEVKLALARGINGFTFNILSLKDIEEGNHLDNLLKAAQAVDPRFAIVVMPDMSSLQKDLSSVETIIHMLYHREGLYHSDDGRLVIAPFLSESVNPKEWESLIKRLENAGKPIAFIPTFLSAKNHYVRGYLPISDGMGTFGTPLIGQGKAQHSAIETTRHNNKFYMAGISPQGYRPKAYIYWESQGSRAYRDTWEDIIETNANAVQLTTWNDFAESTQVSPYTDMYGTSGTGYYNLTGYYATWFLTGKQPEIKRDVLYYFHRKQGISAPTPNLQQSLKSKPIHIWGKDMIDVVAFLTAPATVKVTINNTAHTEELSAGLQGFTVPLQEGKPHFKLIRDDQTIINFESDAYIYGQQGMPSGYGDLTYWSGGATENGTCMTENFMGL